MCVCVCIFLQFFLILFPCAKWNIVRGGCTLKNEQKSM